MADWLSNRWLEEEPSALYGWYTGQQPGGLQNWWSNMYPSVYQGYMGKLAGQIKGGQDPTLQWADYLKDFPWLEEWYKQSPYQRGERQNVYNPRKRWMIY